MDESLTLGAHLVTPRRGYTHHGIYVGDGRVVHYAGFSRGIQRGPVEEVSLEHFANGREYFVRADRHVNYAGRDVVDRARSRIGENCYKLLNNNCEHFCEWCVTGRSQSDQVDAWAKFPQMLLLWVRRTVTAVVVPLSSALWPAAS